MKFLASCAAGLFALVAFSARAEQVAPASTGSLLRMVLGMMVVLGLMAAATWLLRRFGVANAPAAGAARLVGGISVGGRERVLVIEVADQWIVVGVAPGRVSALSTMPKQEGIAAVPQPLPVTKSFSSWLQQTIEKRNVR